MLAGTATHPFLWFEDEFDVFDLSVWTRSSDPEVTINNGQLSMLMTSQFDLYVYSNSSNASSAWRLPVGANLTGLAVFLQSNVNFGAPRCCNNIMPLGINGINYQRTGPSSPSSAVSNSCARNATDSTCIPTTPQCSSLYATLTEKFTTPDGTLATASTVGCVGDVCICFNNARFALPGRNFTTILTAVSNGWNITLPGFGRANVTTPASRFSLAGPKLAIGALGGMNPFIAQPGWYTSVPSNAWPSTYLFEKIQYLFPGQCFDNNTISGDGCSASMVDPFCRCSRTPGLVWGASNCSCYASVNISSIPAHSSSLNVMDLSDVPAATTTLSYSGSPRMAFASCPFPNVACNDPGINRYLVVLVNGTVVRNSTVSFVPIASLPPGASPLVVDLATFGAPFSPGSLVQFLWWSSPTVALAPGILDLDGPYVAKSPVFTIATSTLAVVPVNNFTTAEYDLIGGFSWNITFSSNVRFPDSIELWLYNGPVAFGDSAAADLALDSTFTPLSANCSSRGASQGSVLHSCTVSPPEPAVKTSPSYLVARVSLGQQLGLIRSIAVRVLPQPTLSQLQTPLAQNALAAILPGAHIDPRVSWDLFTGSSQIQLVPGAYSNSTFRFGIATGMVPHANITLQWHLLGRAANITIGTVFPCAWYFHVVDYLGLLSCFSSSCSRSSVG